MLPESAWPALVHFSENEGESHTSNLQVVFQLHALYQSGEDCVLLLFWIQALLQKDEALSVCAVNLVVSQLVKKLDEYTLSMSCSYLSPYLFPALLVIYVFNMQIKTHQLIHQRPAPYVPGAY